ncbi:MAG: Cell division protein FtsQ [Verrucomicrobia subdivision 3 bacterium]|nr:Cell division protein FtsQ [Limisphaerales bacterium]MCS1412390.1 Cell division protein FtsQ [Limisphaerales bacterium]
MWFSKKKSKAKRGKATSRRLDVKARRRVVWHDRLGIAVRLAALVFGLGVMGWMGWRGIQFTVDIFLLENDAFALQRFELRTNGRLTPEQVLRWSGVESGDNVLALDLAQIKRNLEMVPMIHEVAVERVIPDRLKVRIRERRPIFKAYCLSRGGRGQRIVMKPFMIDEFGFVLSPQPPAGADLERQAFWQQLPELMGLSGLRLVPGERVQSRQVDMAIQALQAFQESSMTERVKIWSIDISKSRVLVARTSDQQEVTLGRENLASQFHRWELMLDRANRENMRLVHLDLSVKNNHPFRWVQRTREIPRGPSQPQIVRRTKT